MSRTIFSGNKYSFTGNSVHVDTRTRFKIVKMNETHFSDQKDDTVFMTDLHSDREIGSSLRREKDLNGLLLIRRITFLMIYFDNLKLYSLVRIS
jgi:hypothetical protein